MSGNLIVPDISEYQGTPSLAGLPAVIIRAHNGYRPDNSFAANRAAAHAAGCQAVGLYQYLLAGADPVAQAQLLLATVGPLQPGEWLICDLEESLEAGDDQQPRWQAWQQTVAPHTPTAWLYTYLSFAQAHNLTPDWVADYSTTEPSSPHLLWQNTDAYQWPWGRSDASIFHGDISQLVQLVNPPPPAPVPVVIGDSVTVIPFSCTLNADGWFATGVTLPAGMTSQNIVSVVMDAGSPYDGPGDTGQWHLATAAPDYQPIQDGFAIIVIKGDPGHFFTGRVYVA
jgi:hypothetical protein